MSRRGRGELLRKLLALAVLFGLSASAAGEPAGSGGLPASPPASVPSGPTIIRGPTPVPTAPSVLSHGDRRTRTIALTFDACSTDKPSGYDPKIVEVLQETGTPATFFLGGKWMLEHPEVTRELAASPLFELGNHTVLHPHLPNERDERVRRELRETQDVLFSLTGRTGLFLRPPYGEYDQRTVRLAAEQGMTVIQFDLASGDPDRNFTKQRLVEHVVGRARAGSIVVMHVNGRGWHTAEALPEIISRLRKKGYRFCTVGEMASASGRAGGTR